MTPKESKSANVLLNLYIKTYKDTYDEVPELNRYSEKWGFMDMAADLGDRRAAEVIAYYFELRGPHTTKRLFKNYTEMSRIMRQRAEDEERRARIRQETEERVKNWSPRV